MDVQLTSINWYPYKFQYGAPGRDRTCDTHDVAVSYLGLLCQGKSDENGLLVGTSELVLMPRHFYFCEM